MWIICCIWTYPSSNLYVGSDSFRIHTCCSTKCINEIVAINYKMDYDEPSNRHKNRKLFMDTRKSKSVCTTLNTQHFDGNQPFNITPKKIHIIFIIQVLKSFELQVISHRILVVDSNGGDKRNMSSNNYTHISQNQEDINNYISTSYQQESYPFVDSVTKSLTLPPL
ncbi:hypothetical protein R6Q59_006881 [Mikania micrantha]